MSNSKEILRKSLESLSEDLIEAETGQDRGTYGFSHRLKEIFKTLVDLEPKLRDAFPELVSIETLSDFDSMNYTRGDSGMHQLLKSRIKQLLIIIDSQTETSESTNNGKKSLTSNPSLVFGNTHYLHNRELECIFFKALDKSTVLINSNVHETGLDLQFFLMSYQDYLKLKDYWNLHPNNPRNNIGIYAQFPTPPTITELFSIRTNIIDKKFELKKDIVYALVLDNTYSRLQSKTITTKIKFQTLLEQSNLKSDLAIIELTKNKIPLELFNDLSDANDCYIHDHNRQAAIMFRKALETSIKLKIKQAGKSDSVLLDQNDNEQRLSDKLKMLVTESLISNGIKKDIEDTVKWFGDSGVHTKMDIVSDDIQLNIEPKFRKFIKELNLSV